MNRQYVEALYQNDIKRAQEAFEAAVEAAEARKRERLDAMNEADRAAYKSEQEFFFQG